MEKIGLFDLIDKITTPSSGGKTFDNSTETRSARPQTGKKENENLRDPDFGAQQQYMMNAKMQAFMERHENLKADVPPIQKKKRTAKKKEEKRV